MRRVRHFAILGLAAVLAVAVLASCANWSRLRIFVTPVGAPATPVRSPAARPAATASATAAVPPSGAAPPGGTGTPAAPGAGPTATAAAATTDTPVPAPTPAITLLRGPYLQSVTASGAAIVWTTAEDGPGEVAVTGPDGLEQRVAADNTPELVDASAPYDRYTLHVAYLEGLQPGSEYQYRIFTSGAELDLDGPRVLHTAPASGDLRFIVFGDSGTGSGEQLALRDRMASDRFDFTLVAGDVGYQQGTYEQFERNFFGIYGNLLATHPFWPVPGNHDYITDSAQPFLDLFVLPEDAWRQSDHERYYSFDWGDAHIVGLDTEAPFYNISPDASDDMADWLAADLAASHKPWKLVFFHRPAYSSGPHGSDPRIQERLVPILEAGGVEVVFTGHDHDYERTVPLRGGQETPVDAGGITYVVTGGGGASRYGLQPSWFTAFASSVIHYTRVTITGCHLQLEAVTAAGEVIDTATIAHGC